VEKQGQCLTSSQRKLLLKSMQADLPPESRRRIEIMLLANTGQSQTQICKALVQHGVSKAPIKPLRPYPCKST
jgi:putative transposase